MIRTILVALDDSPRAPSVFATAAEIADRFSATLRLLRVVDMPPEFPAAAHSGVDSLAAVLDKRARAELSALAGAHPRARIEPTMFAAGDPARAIIEASDELDVDMIVLGSHGYRGLDVILGTTAAKVANQATRSVLIVHARPDRDSGGGAP